MRRARNALVPTTILLLAGVVLPGCPETKEDLLTQGNLALWRKDADGAIGHFNKVLAMDANDPDAHRGMANAYDEKSDAAKREEWLVKGYKLANLSDQDKRFFRDQLEKHFLAMAEKVKDADAAKYETSLVKAIEYKERSKANGMLARHYTDRAVELAKAGKKKEAADLLAKVGGLKVGRAMKEQALQQEMGLRMQLFRVEFDKAFVAKHQAQLVTEGVFDAENKRFKTAAQADLPPTVKPDDPELTGRALDVASSAAYTKLLEGFAKLSGKPLPSPAPNFSFLQQTWKTESEAWVKRPTTYRVEASVSYDQGVQAIFLIANHERFAAKRKPAAKKPAPAKPAAPAPAPAPAAPAPAAPAPAAPAPTAPAPAAPAPAPAAPAPAPAAPAPAPAAPAPAAPAPAPAAPAPAAN